MSLDPHITKDSGGNYWLRWTPDSRCSGYAFVTPGGKSRTFDPTRTSVKLGKWPEPVVASVAPLYVNSGPAEAARYPSAATIPQPPTAFSGQRCVLMSDVNQHAIDKFVEMCQGTPRGWYTILFSADVNQAGPGGAYFVTDQQIAQVKAVALTGSWCDGTATPISAAQQMKDRRGLEVVCGQFETVPQWNAMKDTVPLGIGNPAEFVGKPQMDELKAYKGKLIGEMLHPDPGYSGQGVNLSSVCVYIDMDAAQGGYQPMILYEGIPAGFKPGASLYTGGKASDDDWQRYRDWTRPQ